MPESTSSTEGMVNNVSSPSLVISSVCTPSITLLSTICPTGKLSERQEMLTDFPSFNSVSGLTVIVVALGGSVKGAQCLKTQGKFIFKRNKEIPWLTVNGQCSRCRLYCLSSWQTTHFQQNFAGDASVLVFGVYTVRIHWSQVYCTTWKWSSFRMHFSLSIHPQDLEQVGRENILSSAGQFHHLSHQRRSRVFHDRTCWKCW